VDNILIELYKGKHALDVGAAARKELYGLKGQCDWLILIAKSAIITALEYNNQYNYYTEEQVKCLLGKNFKLIINKKCC
jgi:hypothetical protein